jgi:hypothetical protein
MVSKGIVNNSMHFVFRLAQEGSGVCTVGAHFDSFPSDLWLQASWKIRKLTTRIDRQFNNWGIFPLYFMVEG